MVSEFCFATHLLQSATDALIAVTDRSLVGSFLFANKKHDRLCRASNRCSATKVLQSSVNACIISVMMIHPGVEPGFQEPESCVRSITLADHNYSIIAYFVEISKKVFSPI